MTNINDPKQQSGDAKQPASIFISGGLWIDIDLTPTGDKQLSAYHEQLRAKRRRQKGYYKLPKNLFGSDKPRRGRLKRK
jgi:hypothetical protein